MKKTPEANKAFDNYYKNRYHENTVALLAFLSALFFLIVCVTCFVIMLFEVAKSPEIKLFKPAEAREHSDDEICDAIYLAEGDKKAKVPFGILSVNCEGYDACRQVCLNTVRNNRRRYADYGYKEYDEFLAFLASRYAPTQGADNDPMNLNRHWLKNVRYFLEKE